MGTDIANWLQVNILSNPQVFQSLIALIMLIFAGFLFSEKSTEKSLFRSKRVWGSMLFVFAIFVFLLANIPDLGDVFIALATIVLACVAIVSFEESRRLRKQYKEQEERNSQAQVLDEIMNWLEEIYTIPLLTHVPLIGSQEELKNLKINTLNKYGGSIAKGLRIRAITSENLSGDFLTEINAFMGILVQFTFLKGKLIEIDLKDSFVGELRKVVEEIETEITKGKKTINVLHNDYTYKLTDSIARLQHKVASLKANLLK